MIFFFIAIALNILLGDNPLVVTLKQRDGLITYDDAVKLSDSKFFHNKLKQTRADIILPIKARDIFCGLCFLSLDPFVQLSVEQKTAIEEIAQDLGLQLLVVLNDYAMKRSITKCNTVMGYY